MKTIETDYETPSLHMVGVSTENGFAASGPDEVTSPDSGIEDATETDYGDFS